MRRSLVWPVRRSPPLLVDAKIETPVADVRIQVIGAAPAPVVITRESHPHPRSPYAVLRGSPRCWGENTCARNLVSNITPRNSDWESCKRVCCCSSLILEPPSKDAPLNEFCAQEGFHIHLDTMLAVKIMTDPVAEQVSSSTITSLQQMFGKYWDYPDSVASFARLQLLCSSWNLIATPSLQSSSFTTVEEGCCDDVLHVQKHAVLFLSPEDSEAAYNACYATRHDQRLSPHETVELKTIRSLRVLLAVVSVRSDSRFTVECAKSSATSRSAPANKRTLLTSSQESSDARLTPEVYDAVLNNVVAQKMETSSRVTSTDIAVAFHFRATSRGSFLNFLRVCLQKGLLLDEAVPKAFYFDIVIFTFREILSEKLFNKATDAQVLDDVGISKESLVIFLSSLLKWHSSHHPLKAATDNDPDDCAQRTHAADELEAMFLALIEGDSSSLEAGEERGSDQTEIDRSSINKSIMSHLLKWTKESEKGMLYWLSASAATSLKQCAQRRFVSFAHFNSTSALSLLKENGWLEPLDLSFIVEKTIPFVSECDDEEFLLDLYSAVLTQVEVEYLGASSNRERRVESLQAALERKHNVLLKEQQYRLAVDGSVEKEPETVLVQLLSDLASFGSFIIHSPHAHEPLAQGSSTTATTTSSPQGQRAMSFLDAEAAVLGGPVEFFRYSWRTAELIGRDIRRYFRLKAESTGVENLFAFTPSSPLDAEGGAHSPVDSEVAIPLHSGSSASPCPSTLSVPPLLRQRYLNFLEQIVVTAQIVAGSAQEPSPLVCDSLAEFIAKNIDLPNLHDEYRRKMFLLVNVVSREEHHRSAAATLLKNTASDHDGVPQELQKLTGALPLHFLPWASTNIAKDVLTASAGNNTRYVHVLRTAVDLQLPPSTARSRVAGVIALYKLIQQQREKLSPDDYFNLVKRCLLSLPLSYFLSSWTLFTWWSFVALLVFLHLAGWSLEASYVARQRLRCFAKDLDVDTPDIVASKLKEQCEGYDDITEWLSTPSKISLEEDRTLIVTLPPTVKRDDRRAMSLIVAEHIRDHEKSGAVFVLRVQTNGFAVVADDVIKDAAARIRKEANTASNPLLRVLFNLFPLHRKAAEVSLIDILMNNSATVLPLTFVLILPPETQLGESALVELRKVFSKRYLSTLVVISPSHHEIHTVSKRLLPFDRKRLIVDDEDSDEDDNGAPVASLLPLQSPAARAHAAVIPSFKSEGSLAELARQFRAIIREMGDEEHLGRRFVTFGDVPMLRPGDDVTYPLFGSIVLPLKSRDYFCAGLDVIERLLEEQLERSTLPETATGTAADTHPQRTWAHSIIRFPKLLSKFKC